MRSKAVALFCVSLTLLLYPLRDAEAQLGGKLGRVVGVVSIGGSVFFALEARDYRQRADDLYDDYEQATTTASAEDLYDEVTQNDFKSGAHLVVSLCLAINGLHLLFSSTEPDLKELYGEVPLAKQKGLALRLEGDPRRQQIGVLLAKRL